MCVQKMPCCIQHNVQLFVHIVASGGCSLRLHLCTMSLMQQLCRVQATIDGQTDLIAMFSKAVQILAGESANNVV